MEKQTIQTGVCDNCGAGIRPDAIFCYHCGAQVARVSASENGSSKNIVSVAESTPVIDKDIAAPLPELKKPVRGNSGQLKTSPAARRKVVKKEAETAKFVWVEKKSASNFWFVIAALVIAGITVLVLMAMLYIK